MEQDSKNRINKIMQKEKIKEQSKNPETLAAVHTHTHKCFKE